MLPLYAIAGSLSSPSFPLEIGPELELTFLLLLDLVAHGLGQVIGLHEPVVDCGEVSVDHDAGLHCNPAVLFAGLGGVLELLAALDCEIPEHLVDVILVDEDLPEVLDRDDLLLGLHELPAHVDCQSGDHRAKGADDHDQHDQECRLGPLVPQFLPELTDIRAWNLHCLVHDYPPHASSSTQT